MIGSGLPPVDGRVQDQTGGREGARLLGWTIAANIVKHERAGKMPGKYYLGTPVFKAGTKIYLGYVHSGTLDGAHFIGRNRTSGRLSNSVVRFTATHNFRATPIYSPSLFAALQRLEVRLFNDRAEAETFAALYGSFAFNGHGKAHPGSSVPAALRKESAVDRGNLHRFGSALSRLLARTIGRTLESKIWDR